MDLRQLRTFSCVAELGSLSKASDKLRIAQVDAHSTIDTTRASLEMLKLFAGYETRSA